MKAGSKSPALSSYGKEKMHTLKSNKRYKLITVLVAAPADLSDAAITDGLNEMLNAAVDLPACQSVVRDYRFIDAPASRRAAGTAYEVKKVGSQPEEGEAFVDAWPTC